MPAELQTNIYVTPTQAQSSRIPPVVRELQADLETPVSVYLKLAGRGGPSFLLESVTGGEQLARYSFIGLQPDHSYVIRGRDVTVISRDGSKQEVLPAPSGDPLDCLRGELARFRPAPYPGLPRFSGGLAGFLGYELIQFFEPTVPVHVSGDLPDGIFMLTDTVVVFDHAFNKLLLIANVHNEDEDSAAAMKEANARLDDLENTLRQPVPNETQTGTGSSANELHALVHQAEYEDMVRTAKEHITAGDIFQVVLSQHMLQETQASPFSIYRALRRLNPSPYMFFFDFDDLAGDESFFLIGASPELNVRLEEGKATIRPIAGTRPRGDSPEVDKKLEAELLADPKELAEHVMLVDLARNDLGRVCRYGSVRVSEQMGVERYSHVMHIVSQVEGELSSALDAFDLVRATFPAGTVSGAPKIRAMQIIHDLEKHARGPYAGAVGYFSYDGSMDTCIAIRTLVMRGRVLRFQAGAGIVTDSDPQREYIETMNKARALEIAVRMAEEEIGRTR